MWVVITILAIADMLIIGSCMVMAGQLSRLEEEMNGVGV